MLYLTHIVPNPLVSIYFRFVRLFVLSVLSFLISVHSSLIINPFVSFCRQKELHPDAQGSA